MDEPREQWVTIAVDLDEARANELALVLIARGITHQRRAGMSGVELWVPMESAGAAASELAQYRKENARRVGTKHIAYVASGWPGVAAYVVAALWLGLGVPLIVRSCLLLSFVAMACGLVALHLERTSRRSFLAELAERDPLTGLKNRRVFDEHMERLWNQAIVEARALTIILVDVDHFKAYNDRYGHQAGDHALQRVAATLQNFVVRPHDVLARYGGEEFAAILYDVEGFDAKSGIFAVFHANYYGQTF